MLHQFASDNPELSAVTTVQRLDVERGFRVEFYFECVKWQPLNCRF